MKKKKKPITHQLTTDSHPPSPTTEPCSKYTAPRASSPWFHRNCCRRREICQLTINILLSLTLPLNQHSKPKPRVLLRHFLPQIQGSLHQSPNPHLRIHSRKASPPPHLARLKPFPPFPPLQFPHRLRPRRAFQMAPPSLLHRQILRRKNLRPQSPGRQVHRPPIPRSHSQPQSQTLLPNLHRP